MEGLNIRFSVTRNSPDTDDRVGGANITGTLYLVEVRGRLANSPAQELLLQQGLEVNQLWRAQFRCMADVREQDVLVVTSPTTHPLWGETFRVINVRFPSFNDARRFKQLTLSRIVRSRTQQH